MNRWQIIALCLLAGAMPAVRGGARAEAAAGGEQTDLASKVLKMTGARTKIVWARAVEGRPGKNWEVLSEDYELMVFDTAEGKARRVLPGPAMYGCPWITPNGRRIIFTTRAGKNDEVHVVDWDGRNRRTIAQGFGHCVWADPKTGIQWVYISVGRLVRILPDNTTNWVNNDKNEIYRYRIDKPSVRQLVWKGPSSVRLRVSADGTRAGSEFGWPKAGVANLTKGTWKHYGTGCNAMIAPDNSYRFFHMGEAVGHRGVMMYDPGGTNKRAIWFKGMPGSKPRDDSWIPKWSSDVRFLTITSPSAGKRSEIFLGRFDRRFTRVVKWVRITDRPGQDAYAYAWIDPGLGQYFGKAPLTVSIPAKLTPGQWKWDYGDGTKESAPAGKHTYNKEGTYHIVARKGKKVLRGWVNVNDRRAPGVTRARLQDPTHVRIQFDEPVRLRDPKAAFVSGRAVKGMQLSTDGVELTLELTGALRGDDTLVLEGVWDRADPPNLMTDNRVRIRPDPWPGNRDRVAFVWETAYKPNIYHDPASSSFKPVSLTRLGRARLDRLGAMTLTGGIIYTRKTAAGIVRLCKQRDQLTIQATITPARAAQGTRDVPARILGCNRASGGWDQANFALHQEGEQLVFYLRNKTRTGDRYFGAVQRIPLYPLAAGASDHCVITYKPGSLVWYRNGVPAGRTDKVQGALSWGRADTVTGVHFGASFRRGSLSIPWRGKIEGVAIYARAVGGAEAAKDYAQYAKVLRTRKPVPQIRLLGKLVGKSKVPRASDIAPYDSALVVYEYLVAKVRRGAYAHKKIRVARWALLERKKTALARAPVGSQAELTVEKFSDHPELEAEVLRDTLDEDLDLALYVELEPPDAPDPAGKPPGPAKGRLSLAKSYLAAGMTDKATQILQDIIKKHPGTDSAKKARELLKKARSKD